MKSKTGKKERKKERKKEKQKNTRNNNQRNACLSIALWRIGYLCRSRARVITRVFNQTNSSEGHRRKSGRRKRAASLFRIGGVRATLLKLRGQLTGMGRKVPPMTPGWELARNEEERRDKVTPP